MRVRHAGCAVAEIQQCVDIPARQLFARPLVELRGPPRRRGFGPRVAQERESVGGETGADDLAGVAEYYGP